MNNKIKAKLPYVPFVVVPYKVRRDEVAPQRLENHEKIASLHHSDIWQ